MDTEEPTDIREFLPEGATAEVMPEQQDLTPLVMQMLGKLSVELEVARLQIAQLQQQVAVLNRRLSER